MGEQKHRFLLVCHEVRKKRSDLSNSRQHCTCAASAIISLTEAEEERKTEVETNGNQDSLQGSSWASKKSFEWLLQRIHNAWKWRPLPWITEERKQNEMIFVFWTKKNTFNKHKFPVQKKKTSTNLVLHFEKGKVQFSPSNYRKSLIFNLQLRNRTT